MSTHVMVGEMEQEAFQSLVMQWGLDERARPKNAPDPRDKYFHKKLSLPKPQTKGSA